MRNLSQLTILMRGAGEMATGVAVRLHRSGFTRLMLLEQPQPLAVRRTVCFSEAVYDGRMTVEGITCVRIENAAEREAVWGAGHIPVFVDPEGRCIPEIAPDVSIEATLAKCNVGLTLQEAPLTIGVGPGFTVGKDARCIVESNRGPCLGRVLYEGSAEPNTGIPGSVNGLTVERVLRAPVTGCFTTRLDIGSPIREGDTAGEVDGVPVHARISGVVRGLLRTNTQVVNAVKIGDIEPRHGVDCHRVSEKALAIGGGVLEAILNTFLRGA